RDRNVTGVQTCALPIYKDEAGEKALRGLSEEVVRNISGLKDEPEWMLKTRLKGLRYFDRKPMPTWGADLSGIDFDRIKYFVRSRSEERRVGRADASSSA